MNDMSYRNSIRRLTYVWVVTVTALFLVLVFLGWTMRSNQGTWLHISPRFFYAIMTVHGLGMAGTAFVGALACATYLLTRYVRPSAALGWLIYYMTFVGVVGLVTATLIGGFGAGWYVLYPLPFHPMGVWGNWATGLAIISLIVLGVAWLLAQLDLFRAIVSEYGFTNSLGWEYLGGTPKKEIPSLVLILMLAVLIPGIITTIVGAVMLVMYLAQWINPALSFSPLLLKNMVFIFGHTLVNITMYMGVAFVYELMPKFTGRPWKVNKIVVYSWNATCIIVILAVFHHLYMDFVQPLALQVTGQSFSYLAAIPSTAVTIMGLIGQVYHSGLKWKFSPICFYAGLTGWVIGGLAAVIDATIMVNFTFHNTLWVPAHFHTYFLAGFFVVLWGTFFYVTGSKLDAVGNLGLIMVLIGAYGFLSMFYISGVSSVPRRYASYASIPLDGVKWVGQHAAQGAAISVLILILGLAFVFYAIYSGMGSSWFEPADKDYA